MVTLLAVLTAVSWANIEIVLNQKQVAEAVIKSSNFGQIVNLNAQLSRLQYAETLSAFDFKLTAEGLHDVSKQENLSGSSLDKTENFKTSIGLEKRFATGSLLDLSFERNSFKYDLPTSYTGSLPPAQTQDVLSLTLEQDLLRNAFGRADRAELRSAEKTYEAAQIQRVTDLQTAVLDGVRLFWETYTSMKSTEEAVAARDRYKNLVISVRRKNSFGYAAPGELSQVQAELEARESTVRDKNLSYLEKKNSLLNLLSLPSNSVIKFDVASELPAPPTLPETNVTGLRPYRVAQAKMIAADEKRFAGQSQNWVDLSLMAKLASAGLETSSSGSYSEMTSGNRPSYYMGLQLEHQFGSGTLRERELNRKLLADIERLKFQDTQKSLQSRELELREKVRKAYENTVSAKAQKDFRDRAARDLQRSFTQGRTDISLLIDSLNRYSSSEIAYLESIGDYQVALNEWAAFRDQLVPELKLSEIESFQKGAKQ
ncbi:MAG: TolC family protein [Proteobacteria bacterium]|jgi:outer membrane protein TolC|nr:TolC family protein [Pseudomonadota bacterium]